jgi:thioesterase domain-containing protein/acyl carrier protein
VGIWQEVLGVEPVGIHDNFFDLGGHSLLAVSLMGKVNRVLGIEIPLNQLFKYPTIATLLSGLDEGGLITTHSSLVTLNPVESSQIAPLFLVPGVGGNSIGYYPLAQHLGKEIPIYALEPKGLDGLSEPLTTVEELAHFYIQLITEVQPQGPYHLAGHSFGGTVIYEIACQLQHSGQEVVSVMMIDSLAPLSSREKYPLPDSEVDWVQLQLKLIAEMFGADLSPEVNEVKTIPIGDVYHYLQQVLHDKFNIEQSIMAVRGTMKVVRAQLQADYSADFNQYSGTITVFPAIGENDLTREHYHPLRQESGLGWEHLTTGSVQVINVSGLHFTMLQEPFVRELAKQMKTVLLENQ